MALAAGTTSSGTEARRYTSTATPVAVAPVATDEAPVGSRPTATTRNLVGTRLIAYTLTATPVAVALVATGFRRPKSVGTRPTATRIR